MADVARENPVNRALCVPRLICGVDWILFFGLIGIGNFLFVYYHAIVVPFLTVVALLRVFARLQKMDPRLLRILGLNARYKYKTRYDAAKVEPVEIVWC